jgi:hypothetical protein
MVNSCTFEQGKMLRHKWTIINGAYIRRKDIGFDNIQGYDDLKDTVRRALDAEDNYNLLFIGPPASAKTLFLLTILESKNGVCFDGQQIEY